MSIIELVFDQASVHIGVLISAVINYVEMPEFIDIRSINFHLFINSLGNNWRRNEVDYLKAYVKEAEKFGLVGTDGPAADTCDKSEENDHG